MKYLLAVVVTVYIILFFTSCAKNADSTASSGNCIIGKWDLVYDSSYVGVGLGNHAVNYYGKAGDYFDFKPDGTLYILEDMKPDTVNYKVVSDTEITIGSFGTGDNGSPVICKFTVGLPNANNARIWSPELATPGGIFGKKVGLAR